jgi:hypothetical protein
MERAELGPGVKAAVEVSVEEVLDEAARMLAV